LKFKKKKKKDFVLPSAAELQLLVWLTDSLETAYSVEGLGCEKGMCEMSTAVASLFPPPPRVPSNLLPPRLIAADAGVVFRLFY